MVTSEINSTRQTHHFCFKHKPIKTEMLNILDLDNVLPLLCEKKVYRFNRTLLRSTALIGKGGTETALLVSCCSKHPLPGFVQWEILFSFIFTSFWKLYHTNKHTHTLHHITFLYTYRDRQTHIHQTSPTPNATADTLTLWPYFCRFVTCWPEQIILWKHYFLSSSCNKNEWTHILDYGCSVKRAYHYTWIFFSYFILSLMPYGTTKLWCILSLHVGVWSNSSFFLLLLFFILLPHQPGLHRCLPL